MTDLHILHISDLHFAPRTLIPIQTQPARMLDLAVDAVALSYPSVPFILAISGDITTAGDVAGFTEATRSILALKSRLNIQRTVVCPGNHDVQTINPDQFIDFNKFAAAVTGDPEQYWTAKHPVSVTKSDGYTLVLVNTAHEGNHSYGSTPLQHLRAALDSSVGTWTLVMFHHSPIASNYAGGGMNDAYDMLALISEYDVAAVLHGHVHSDQMLRIGSRSTLMYGVGSLGFPPDSNMNNQFAIHTLRDGVATDSQLYRFHANSDTFKVAP